MDILYKKDFRRIFHWSELNGKQLEITVSREEGYISVVGYERESENKYVLYSGRE